MQLRASLGPVVHDGVDRQGVSDLLDHLSPGGACLLLERVDLDYDQRYIQACCLGERWALEYREGDAAHHYRAEAEDKSDVLDALMGWAGSEDGWRDSLEWTPLALSLSAPVHSDPGPHDWTQPSDRMPA